MPDHADAGEEPGSLEAPPLPTDADPRESVEAYDTEDGVVFYDARNPLAWLKSNYALSLDRSA